MTPSPETIGVVLALFAVAIVFIAIGAAWGYARNDYRVEQLEKSLRASNTRGAFGC